MTEQPPKRPRSNYIGHIFALLSWIIIFFLLFTFSNKYLNQEKKPKAEISSTVDYNRVTIGLNKDHQYLIDGGINGIPTTFLLDTGASDIAMPYSWAKKLALTIGEEVNSVTASGKGKAYRTTINELLIGNIALTNIEGILMPDFDGEYALLGMSALKKLELYQADGIIILSQKKAS